MESILLEFAKARPKGFSVEDFCSLNPSSDTTVLVTCINTLLVQKRIEIFQEGGRILYRVPNSQESLEGLPEDDLIVYECVRSSGNKGIWTKDIKTRTNLHQAVINKSLKTLETRRLIKAIKSTKHTTRKLYILFDLEPSEDVTGGIWFLDSELDEELIQQLCRLILGFISNFPGQEDLPLDSAIRKFASLSEICEFVSHSRLLSVELTLQDVEKIVNILCFDGLVERAHFKYPTQSPGETRFRSLKISSADNAPFSDVDVPCGSCSRKHDCSFSGAVTPVSCDYYTRWQ